MSAIEDVRTAASTLRGVSLKCSMHEVQDEIFDTCSISEKDHLSMVNFLAALKDL